MTCNNCKQGIDDERDDNYNAARTQIKCPECGLWQFVNHEDGDLAVRVMGDGENARIERLLEDIRPGCLGILDILDEQDCCEFEWQLGDGTTIVLRRH
jgi:hypothetical protein